ncbi:PLP-dependent transferase, partial [Aureobasidium melanogenum]
MTNKMDSGPVGVGAAALAYFGLEKDYRNFNHGAYGTYPIEVRDVLFRTLLDAESRPCHFVNHQQPKALQHQRSIIAKYINAPTESCVFVQNATMAFNIVLRNLTFRQGDCILYFPTTFEACKNTIKHVVETSVATAVMVESSLRPDDICKALKQTITNLKSSGRNPRICIVDTLSSFPGIRMPFEKLVPICKDHGVLSYVDGAHGIGHIPLDTNELNPDFLASNCHKWLYVPRKCAVLYVAERNHALVRSGLPTGSVLDAENCESPSPLAAKFGGLSNLDGNSCLCVSAAIDFRKRVVWQDLRGEEAIYAYLQQLAVKGSNIISEALGGTDVFEETYGIPNHCGFANVRLPLDYEQITKGDMARAKECAQWMMSTLIDKYNTSLLIAVYDGSWWARISAQIYLDLNDFIWLGGTLKMLCDEWLLVVVSVLFSMFMYSLDGTIVADLVPSIVNEFDSVPLLPWLSVGFMVGSIVTVLPLGKLFSKYNAKWLYVISVVLFLASSALCGAAPTMSAMIVGRVFLGMSGNGIYFGIMTLLSVCTDDKERPMYLSLVGLVWGIGTVLGPVVGGGFDKVSWRWAFYLNLIIGGVFAPVYLFMLPSFDPQPKTVSLFGRAKNFDFVGAALSIASILCLVMAINFGNALYAWNSGQIISMFVLSFVLLVVFAVQQKFAWFTTRTERMFPAHLIRNKEANLLFICAACANTAGFLPIYYLPVYFQFSRGDNALEAAVRLLPLITILSATIIANGYLMSKLGYYQPWYIGGAALALIGNILASRINIHTSVSAIYGYEVLIALGSGAFIQAGYATIQTVVSADDTSYGIAYMMLAQFTGIVMGLSIGGAIFINEALKSLKALLPMLPEAQLRSVISGTSSDAISKIPVELPEQTISAVVDSLRNIFIPSYVAAAVALVTAVFLRLTET